MASCGATCGQIGVVTRAVLRAWVWAMWPPSLCGPRYRQRRKKEKTTWLQNPCPLLSAQHADNIKVATCPLQEGHVWAKVQSGKALAMSGVTKWQRNESGEVTCAILGAPIAGRKLRWLHNPWRLGAHVGAKLPQNQCRLGDSKRGRKGS